MCIHDIGLAFGLPLLSGFLGTSQDSVDDLLAAIEVQVSDVNQDRGAPWDRVEDVRMDVPSASCRDRER